MALKVKYYHSGMRGAPQKSGTPGSSIGVLDAVLLNGFGEVTAQSVSIVNGRVRLVFNNGENFSPDTTVIVSGASVPSVNGEHTITIDTVTTASWATTEPDQPVTGTIKVKVAPLNWIKPFSGTNLAVYKSPAIESSGHYLQVDDGQAYYTKFVTYETMQDALSGTQRAPTDTNDFSYVQKSEVANTSPRSWFIVGDDLGFYFCTNSYAGYDSHGVFYFGDSVPDKTNDKYRFILSGSSRADNAHQGSVPVYAATTETNCFVSRSLNGIGLAIKIRFCADGPGGYTTSGYSQPNGNYPAQVNNGVLLSRIQYNDSNGRRGIVPGIYSVSVNGLYQYFSNGSVLDGQKDLAGRRLVYLTVSSYASVSGSYAGCCFIDITGPWSR